MKYQKLIVGLGISFKFYDTTKLWWLLCKFNDIKNPFSELEAGQIIRVPKQEIVNSILNILKTN
jgi:hypothetical protein